MAQVRMLVDISGGRADGTEWPRSGEVLVCDDGEAQGHVAMGRAEWAPDGAEPAAGAPEASLAGDEPQDAENGSKPVQRDPKQAWVDHAVAQGCDPAVAESMTKSDLIQTYGNPS